MQEILRTQGHSLSHHLIRTFIEAAGYKWRKARVVLTSKDPNYQTKVDGIVKILTELKDDEAFFSIDEFGPFAVKKRGGRKRVGPEETYTVPQWEKSKGSLICQRSGQSKDRLCCPAGSVELPAKRRCDLFAVSDSGLRI